MKRKCESSKRTGTKALGFLSFLSNALSENIRIFPISPLSLTSKWESAKITLFQTSKLGQRARLALQPGVFWPFVFHYCLWDRDWELLMKSNYNSVGKCQSSQLVWKAEGHSAPSSVCGALLGGPVHQMDSLFTGSWPAGIFQERPAGSRRAVLIKENDHGLVFSSFTEERKFFPPYQWVWRPLWFLSWDAFTICSCNSKSFELYCMKFKYLT